MSWILKKFHTKYLIEISSFSLPISYLNQHASPLNMRERKFILEYSTPVIIQSEFVPSFLPSCPSKSSTSIWTTNWSLECQWAIQTCDDEEYFPGCIWITCAWRTHLDGAPEKSVTGKGRRQKGGGVGCKYKFGWNVANIHPFRCDKIDFQLHLTRAFEGNRPGDGFGVHWWWCCNSYVVVLL